MAEGQQPTRTNEKLTATETELPDELPDELLLKGELRLEGVVLCESTLLTSPLLPYVRMIVGLLEGIQLRCQELVKLLRQSLRQHSIAYQTRTDYVLRFLHQHPP